jgi:hypothetical protein
MLVITFCDINATLGVKKYYQSMGLLRSSVVFSLLVLVAGCGDKVIGGETPTTSTPTPTTSTASAPTPTTLDPVLPSQVSRVSHVKIEQLFYEGTLPSGVGAAVHPDGRTFIFSKDLPASAVARIKAVIPWVEFVSPLPPFTDENSFPSDDVRTTSSPHLGGAAVVNNGALIYP